ncbi:hypothetical protein L1987_22243 [Smallanthus sonchifolius]|uniref:Uncharacterized protein n=1 Tax=Smallanthus sonchifolius TaxID=185202 RepID=A0ACB9IEI7_9ASTR|nr:hypothetical protein L1987_22243 [Smallanthus sonchifolius]
MAASFPPPPVNKPTTSFQPRRGEIKAQIFGGIAEAAASAASRVLDFLGLVRTDDASAPETPPQPQPQPLTMAADGEDGAAIVRFITVEKDP